MQTAEADRGKFHWCIISVGNVGTEPIDGPPMTNFKFVVRGQEYDPLQGLPVTESRLREPNEFVRVGYDGDRKSIEGGISTVLSLVFDVPAGPNYMKFDSQRGTKRLSPEFG